MSTLKNLRPRGRRKSDKPHDVRVPVIFQQEEVDQLEELGPVSMSSQFAQAHIFRVLTM